MPWTEPLRSNGFWAEVFVVVWHVPPFVTMEIGFKNFDNFVLYRLPKHLPSGHEQGGDFGMLVWTVYIYVCSFWAEVFVLVWHVPPFVTMEIGFKNFDNFVLYRSRMDRCLGD